MARGAHRAAAHDDAVRSERIVEDISRYPLVVDKIVEHKGGVVPDFQMQHQGCSEPSTTSSPLHRPSVSSVCGRTPQTSVGAR